MNDMTATEIRKTQERFTAQFLAVPGVRGMRIRTRGGVALQVTVDPAAAPTLPNEFEGIPVRVVAGTPAILAYAS